MEEKMKKEVHLNLDEGLICIFEKGCFATLHNSALAGPTLAPHPRLPSSVSKVVMFSLLTKKIEAHFVNAPPQFVNTKKPPLKLEMASFKCYIQA